MGGGGRGMRVVARPPTSSTRPSSQARREARHGLRQRRRLPREVRRSAPGTSRCSSSATSTATSSTSSSATARSSGGTRRSSRSPRRRTSTRRSATRICDAAVRHRRARSATTTPARSSSWSTPTRASSTSSRSTRGSRSSTPSPRWSPASTSSSAQILIAQGAPLADPEIGLPDQEAVQTHGFAIQCRVTTEDPANNFMPDYGRLSALPLGRRPRHPPRRRHGVRRRGHHAVLRLAAGEGHRLRRGVRRRRPPDGARAAGVPHPRREDEHPVPDQRWSRTRTSWPAGARRGSSTRRRSCSRSRPRRDRATKLLTFIGDVIVNGHPEVVRTAASRRTSARRADPAGADRAPPAPTGTRDRLQELGPEEFARWMREQKRAAAHRHHVPRRPPVAAGHAAPHLRHARACADAYARHLPGAVLARDVGRGDVRHGDAVPQGRPVGPPRRAPRARSRTSCSRCCCGPPTRSATPTTPTTSCATFVSEAAAGRHRRLPHLRLRSTGCRTCSVAIDAVLRAGDALRGGHLLHRRHPRPDADQVRPDVLRRAGQGAGEARARTSWRIKDMAGLCKPYAAAAAGQGAARGGRHPDPLPHARHRRHPGVASVLTAAEAGVDIADGAIASMSRPDLQPSLNALVEALRFTARDTGLDARAARTRRPTTGRPSARVLRAVRERHARRHRRGLRARDARRAVHEPAASRPRRWASTSRWHEVCRAYAEVNQLFGDIVKVTPSSKVVGDMALFMVANNLTPERRARPEPRARLPRVGGRVLRGRARPAAGRLPARRCRSKVLQGRRAADRAGPAQALPPADFDAARDEAEKTAAAATRPSATWLSYLLYPQVFADFAEHQRTLRRHVSVLPTPVFFYGLEPATKS